jgi:ketosteroid isomerase-like protein
MAHENEKRLRDLYDAFSRGDFDAVFGMCTAHMVFEVPGQQAVLSRSRFPR